MPEAAKQVRGDSTRLALIEAALVVFGRDGFDAASTRSIADLAGANQASIAYHFGSKRGLYIAVFEHIDAALSHMLRPLAAKVMNCSACATNTDEGRIQAIKGIRYILFGLVDLYGELMSPNWVSLVMHEQQMPSDAFDVLYQGFYGQAVQRLADLIGTVLAEEDTKRAKILGLMFVGQILSFTSARTTATRLLQVDKLRTEEMDIIKHFVEQNLCAHFHVTVEDLA